MNNDLGVINVTMNDGKQVKVRVLFTFEIEIFKKRYIAYTFNDENISKEDVEEQNVYISEIDYDTYEIKSIPVDELQDVLNTYNQIKLDLIKE